jgi:integrase
MASIRKRTNSKGETSFFVEVRLKGFPPQRATFNRKTDATKWASNTEAAIREGRYFKTSEARKHTLAELVDRYVRDVLPQKPKSRAKQTSQLNWWKSEIGAYTLAEVTPARIAETRDKLAHQTSRFGKPTSPATVVRYMAALSHAFSVAVKEWGWLEDNPIRKVRKPKEPRGRIRFLSDEEQQALLAACKESNYPHLYTIVVLALATGMRQGEILGLTWPVVDLHQGRITLHETKNNEIRTVPLVGPALAALKEHARVRRLDTDLLFPGRNPHKPIFIRAPWLAAVRTARLEDFRFHDLRHSAASYMLMSGATLGEIASLLGHKQLQMVQRYSHLAEPAAKKVAERMADQFLGGA